MLLKQEAPFNRKEMQIYLEKKNIQTRVNFKVIDGGVPNADDVMKHGLLLPIHHGLTEEMFQRLHSTIQDFVGDFV